MRCYLCNNSMVVIQKGVRNNSSVNVCKCSSCGLISLDDFSHITYEYYPESNMRDDDPECASLQDWTDLTYKDDYRRYQSLLDDINGKTILDYGAGCGGFCKLAKETAKEVYAVELDKETKTIYNQLEIPHFINIDNIPQNKQFDIITAFHVFEHLKDPIDSLKQISSRLKPSGKIILEYPNADEALLTLYESEHFAKFSYWDCHLMLFNVETSRILVEKAGLKLTTIKGIQRYPISNHLYWLAKNLPGGHDIWNFLDTKLINAEYQKILADKDKTDTLWIEISKL